MAESFSSALRLGGLDDYLSPAQECVLPLLKPNNQSQKDAASNTTEIAGAVAPRVRPARAAARRRAQQRTENANPEAPRAASLASIEPPVGERAPAPASTEASTTSQTPSREKAQAPVAPPSSDEAVSRVGKISLSDCLSCSGCLTSAEGILLNQQSAEEFFSVLSRKKRRNANIPRQQQKQAQIQHEKALKIVAISLSSQCIAAVALEFSCSPTVAAERLSSLFRLLGADFVFSMAATECLVLLESQKEFVGRLYRHQKSIGKLGMEWEQAVADAAVVETVMGALLPSSGPLPLITSYCPGLVLYAEKNLEAPLLSFLSRVRSAQQVQGLLCKSAVRGTVEAVSFLLALKAHAWPGSAAGAAGSGEAITSTKPRREGNAPWDLLRILLGRSPYTCYASDLSASDDGAAAGGAGDACTERERGAAQDDGDEVSAAFEAPLTDSLAADTASPTARTSTAEVGVVDAATSERRSEGLSPEDVLHVCVMPCFDRKLEAARPDFRHCQEESHKNQEQHDRNADFSSFVASPLAFGAPREPWAEVDMVLATSEIPQLLQAAGVSFDSLPSAPLDCLVPGTALRLVAHSLRCAAAASSRSADLAARCHQPSNLQRTEVPYDAKDALITASARAAEKGAAMADDAAMALPVLASLHVRERRQCKGITTEIARPAAVLAGSGGYLEFLFLQTARGLFGRDLSPERLEFIRGPNEELQSLAVLPHSQTVTAQTARKEEAIGRSRGRRRGLWSDTTPALLRGAFAYGFRNIQNVVQQLRLLLSSENSEAQAIKPAASGAGSETGTICGCALGIREIGSSVPHVFEIGACPGGCLNGGGQTIKMDPVKVQGSSCSRVNASEGCSQDRPILEGSIRAYEPKIIGKNREPLTSLTRLVHTEFPLISPQVHPLVAPAYAFLFGCCYGKEGGSAAAAALGEFESLLQQTEPTEVLQDFFCPFSSSFIPARFWLAPRVTAVFRTDFRPAAASTKSSAFVSLSDLKW